MKYRGVISKGHITIVMLFFVALFVGVAFLTSRVDDMSLGNKYIQETAEDWKVIVDGQTYEITLPVDRENQIKTQACTFEMRIPTAMWGKTMLIYTQNGSFKVYFDNQFVYQYGEKDNKLFGRGTGLAWHLIEIPDKLSESYVRIEMRGADQDALRCLKKVYVGSGSSCVLQIYDGERVNSLETYFIFILLCCITVIVLLQRYNGVVIDNLVYGIPYVAAICLYYITQLDTVQFYMGNRYICYLLNGVAYLFMPMFLMCLFGEHLRSLGKRLYRLLFIWAVLEIVVVILLQALNLCELYVTRNCAGILNIVCVFLIILSYVRSIKKQGMQLDVWLLLGAGSLYLFTLLLNVRGYLSYGIVVSGGYDLHGVVVFVMVVTIIEFERFNHEIASREHMRNLAKIQHATIGNLAELIESRDEVTGFHVKNTVCFVEIIVRGLMEKRYYADILDEITARNIIEAAPLHDVGKITISDSILLAPRKLTPEEFDQIKAHTVMGGKIVKKILADFGDENYTRIAVEIATCHHERWDGKGYPYGYKEEDIPLSACIMAVADVFDALISKRPYKDAYECADAFDIIKNESGTHFNPKVVEVFCEKKEEVLKAVQFERYGG